MHTRKPRQAGFSLVEMLTVVAIVGVLALVTVPSFVTYFQTNKMKTAMRNFTSDLRTVRERAITQGVQTKITFTPATSNTTASRAYDFWQGNATTNSTTWTQLTQPNVTAKALSMGYTRYTENIAYFPTTGQTFTSSGGVYSVVFYPDGRVGMPAGATTASVIMKTDMKVPQPQYTIDVSPSGRVFAH
ncbi:MAG TPA: GspH/FimT family pseudopilin [Thermoanaerobaculia bacterium]|jgi:type II secretion system protein H|nr:GspH/FimT family pseudopilin [Thermoanaerobaculia bacterium]